MTNAIDWGSEGSGILEYGISRGVLYLPEYDEFSVWNGLVSAKTYAKRQDPDPFYYNGLPISHKPQLTVRSGTLTAYSYPDLVLQAVGIVPKFGAGLFFDAQPATPVHLSYQTTAIDTNGNEYYKLHLVYNAVLDFDDTLTSTLADTQEPTSFSFVYDCLPVVTDGLLPFSYIFLDSRTIPAAVLEEVESILYGSSEEQPRMITPEELIDIRTSYVGLLITPYADKTYEAYSASDEIVEILEDEEFALDWPSVQTEDDITFTAESDT